MYNFLNASYLYGLGLIILFIGASILSYYYRRNEWRALLPNIELRQTLIPKRVGIKRIIRDIILLLALSAIIVVLARPQTPGSLKRDEDQKGIEVMICVDVSNSMLSPDIAPSRISFAKRAVSKILEGMKNDKVGIVAFAADAYIQLPITNDIRSATEYLQDVSPDMLSAQGTNIAEAIELAQTAFSKRNDIGKSIIIITDGESHEGGAEEAVKAARAAGIKVSVVGVGTEQGGLIPTPDGGYLKDDEGNTVTTKLNGEMALAIAQAGGGSYIHTDNTTRLVNALEKDLNTLPKAAIGSINRAGYIEHYMPWAIAALILLILELFISQRRSTLWNKIDLFGHDKNK